MGSVVRWETISESVVGTPQALASRLSGVRTLVWARGLSSARARGVGGLLGSAAPAGGYAAGGVAASLQAAQARGQGAGQGEGHGAPARAAARAVERRQQLGRIRAPPRYSLAVAHRLPNSDLTRQTWEHASASCLCLTCVSLDSRSYRPSERDLSCGCAPRLCEGVLVQHTRRGWSRGCFHKQVHSCRIGNRRIILVRAPAILVREK